MYKLVHVRQEVAGCDRLEIGCGEYARVDFASLCGARECGKLNTAQAWAADCRCLFVGAEPALHALYCRK